MEKSKIFLYFCLSFVSGVLIASFFISSLVLEILLIILGLILIGAFSKKKELVVIGFCLFFLSFGMFHYASNLEKIKTNTLTDLDGKEVSISGVVADEIDRSLDKAKITVDVLSKENKVVGRALVFADKYISLNYRDKVLIKGTVRVPGMIEDFDYQGYLAKDGISVTINYPEIKAIEKGFYTNLWQKLSSFVYSVKDRAGEEIKKDMPVKEAGVMQGMILGDSNRMDADLKQALSMSGLSHVIAISGSHIVLFSAMLFEVLMLFGLWRKQAQTAVIIFTFFYVFMAGMLASAVRAGIMIGLMLLAQIMDRNSSNIRTLAFAGAFMILENPLILKFDLGFQLSFLAVIGLIYAGPVFNGWLNRFFKDKMSYLREIIAMTMSAQLFTFPVLIYSFGYLSIISFISNIVVAPIVPLVMATGIIFPFIGIVFSPLGFAVSLICELLVLCLVWVVEISPLVPFSVLQASIPLYLIIISYIPVIWLIVRAEKRKDLDFLRQ